MSLNEKNYTLEVIIYIIVMLFLEYTHLLYRKIFAFHIYFARKPKYWTYIRLLFQQQKNIILK